MKAAFTAPWQGSRAGLRERWLLVVALLVMCASDAWAGDGTCTLVQADTCVDGPGTKSMGGLDIYRDCWKYEAKYQCLSSTYTDDCGPLIAQGCTEVNTTCTTSFVDLLGNTICTVYNRTYQCQVGGGVPQTVLDCGTQSICASGACYDTSHPADADFARSVAYLEAQREAGRYLDQNNLTVFNGYDNRCKKKLFGLVNCCKSSGGGGLLDNFSLMASAARGAYNVIGSSYVYDALFVSDAPDLVINGFEALFGAGGGSSALAGLMAGDITMEGFLSALDLNPYWLAIQLFITYSGILDCDDASQQTALKRGARLCNYVGSYCSQQLNLLVTKICLEKTETYCCYNSRLARIINQQGRPQLGRGWGSPESPQCAGFSVADFSHLDFGAMDLSEFYADINANPPSVSGLATKASTSAAGAVPAP